MPSNYAMMQIKHYGKSGKKNDTSSKVIKRAASSSCSSIPRLLVAVNQEHLTKLGSVHSFHDGTIGTHTPSQCHH